MAKTKNELRHSPNFQPIPDEFAWDNLGGGVLQSLAMGIYDYQAILREYAQNARDAYIDLERIFPDEYAKSPQSIVISSINRDLSVQDFGIGMDFDHLSSVKNIATTSKLPEDEMAGFRGIGIWAGLEACERLLIETTRFKDPNVYRLTINFGAIVSAFAEKTPNIKKLIDPNYLIEGRTDESRRDAHYTRTKLINLRPSFDLLSDASVVAKLASKILPCRINPSFLFRKDIDSICAGTWNYREFVIKVNINGVDEEVFREMPNSDHIRDVHPEKISNEKGEELARIWYGRTKQDTIPFLNGFQLRVANITVGERNLYSDKDLSHIVADAITLGATGRLAWFVGEIHVDDSRIRPNTPRNQLETGSVSKDFISRLRLFYKDRIDEADRLGYFNARKKDLEKLTEIIKSNPKGIAPSSPEYHRAMEMYQRLNEAVNKTRGRRPTHKWDLMLRNLLNGKDFKPLAAAVLQEARRMRQPLESGQLGRGGEKGALGSGPKLQPEVQANRESKTNISNGEYSRSEELISEIIKIVTDKLGTSDQAVELSSSIQGAIRDWFKANVEESLS
jgi:hypothetical protein